ncbi:MAG: hypothetical protein O3B25_13420, partial [Verrucomicrobia bacterium]|nr:hypothetical protein [Verrucomicrobiota bacterium]
LPFRQRISKGKYFPAIATRFSYLIKFELSSCTDSPSRAFELLATNRKTKNAKPHHFYNQKV